MQLRKMGHRFQQSKVKHYVEIQSITNYDDDHMGYIKASLPYEARHSTPLLNHPYVTAELPSEMLLGIRNVICYKKKSKHFKLIFSIISYHYSELSQNSKNLS